MNQLQPTQDLLHFIAKSEVFGESRQTEHNTSSYSAAKKEYKPLTA